MRESEFFLFSSFCSIILYQKFLIIQPKMCLCSASHSVNDMKLQWIIVFPKHPIVSMEMTQEQQRRSTDSRESGKFAIFMKVNCLWFKRGAVCEAVMGRLLINWVEEAPTRERTKIFKKWIGKSLTGLTWRWVKTDLNKLEKKHLNKISNNKHSI